MYFSVIALIGTRNMRKMMYISQNDHILHHALRGIHFATEVLDWPTPLVRSRRDRTSYFSRRCRGLSWQMSLFFMHRAGQKSNMPTPKWTTWRLRDRRPVTCMTIQLFYLLVLAWDWTVGNDLDSKSEIHQRYEGPKPDFWLPCAEYNSNIHSHLLVHAHHEPWKDAAV